MVFVNRRVELAELSGLLESGTTRLVLGAEHVVRVLGAPDPLRTCSAMDSPLHDPRSRTATCFPDPAPDSLLSFPHT